MFVHRSLPSALALLLAASLAVPSSSLAQTVTGSLSGLVSDASGAAVTGVAIEVTDVDRGTAFRATSNDSGFYVVSPLQPGRYRVTAERTGFRKYVLEPLTIATQQKAALDIGLDVGAVTESVTISGSTQLIDTSTATLSGVVENKRIIDLPLNGRNIYSLAALTPGVFGRRPSTGITAEGFHSMGIFTVNGGRDSSNAILMDLSLIHI